MTHAELKRRFRPARVFRGEGPESGPVTLGRSRIFVLPTRHGVTFALLLCAMLIGSVNYSNSLGYLFTFLLASLAVISILHTYQNMVHLTLQAGRVDPVFAGNRAHFPIRIDNAPGPHRFALQVRTPDRGAEPVIADLPRGNTAIVLERQAPRRGRLRLGRFTIETRFPLNLFRAWSHLDLTVECLVYPKPGPDRTLLLDRVATGQTERDGRQRGHGDFVGLRNYAPGDPPRHVHWRAAARSETLLIKQFGGGTPQELWLDWEQLPGLDGETRLSQLCRWVLDAHESSCAWGLRLPGTELAMARGAGHLRRCLTALALFET